MRQRVPSFPARKTHRRKWARYTRSLVWVPAVSQRRKVLRQARLRVGSGADLVQDAPPANTPITLHLAIQTPNNLPLAVSPPNRPAIASPPPSLRRPTQPSQVRLLFTYWGSPYSGVQRLTLSTENPRSCSRAGLYVP